MADNSTFGRIGRRYPVVSELTVAPIRMASQDISNWVSAIDAARNTTSPRRRQLYELYDNITIDGKVITIMQKRKVNITNKQFVFYKKGKEGEPVERIQTEVIDQPFFDTLLESLEEEDFYGHTLIEIIPGSETNIGNIVKVPQANVSPERGLILPNYMDIDNGIPFRGPNVDPLIKKHIVEFGKPKNYGMLMSLAQYVIYKRGGFGDWAQFAELFGMPFRVGKYDPFDSNTRQKLYTALKEMGGAGFAIIPEGTSIEFPTTNYGSGQAGIFKELIQLCNEEMSQIALGGTMTTEDGASKSQSETHKDGENEIIASRLKKILKFLNGPFRERLQMFGYAEAADGHFQLQDSEVIALKDRILIDEKVAAQVEIKPDYWYEKYGVPMPTGGPKAKEKTEAPSGAEGSQKKKPKVSLSLNISKFYASHSGCGSCVTLSAAERSIEGEVSLSAAEGTPDAELERIAKLLYSGKLKPGSVDKKLLKRTANALLKALKTGYLRSPGSSSFTAKDEEMVKMLRENIFIFSGFKTEKQLREASQLLTDDKGQLRTFADFKQQITELDKTYNITYLAAEYQHAVASSQMASKWISWQELKDDFPNLKYITAGDDRVRDAHAVFNGLIVPMNDPIVDMIMPVKDWGCRCDMDATDEEPNHIGRNINYAAAGPLKGNVGKDGIIFPKNHPYYEASATTKKKVTETSVSVMNQK